MCRGKDQDGSKFLPGNNAITFLLYREWHKNFKVQKKNSNRILHAGKYLLNVKTK